MRGACAWQVGDNALRMDLSDSENYMVNLPRVKNWLDNDNFLPRQDKKKEYGKHAYCFNAQIEL